MACGNSNLLEGGIFRDPTILGGSATNTLLQNCELNSSTISDLKGIDASSASKIADAVALLVMKAIADMSCDTLAPLISKLSSCMDFTTDSGCTCGTQVFVTPNAKQSTCGTTAFIVDSDEDEDDGPIALNTQNCGCGCCDED